MGAQGGQKKVLDPLELELQTVVSRVLGLTWVLRTGLQSHVRAASVLTRPVTFIRHMAEESPPCVNLTGLAAFL